MHGPLNIKPFLGSVHNHWAMFLKFLLCAYFGHKRDRLVKHSPLVKIARF